MHIVWLKLQIILKLKTRAKVIVNKAFTKEEGEETLINLKEQ